MPIKRGSWHLQGLAGRFLPNLTAKSSGSAHELLSSSGSWEIPSISDIFF
jgi:hypothetical protein